jgi:branched-chain amino acid transport system substrate-binding protein
MKKLAYYFSIFGLVVALLGAGVITGCAGEEEEINVTVTGISPSSGEVEDTLAVTITGTNFTDASAVSFGSGITVNSFTVDSETRITANISIAATTTAGLRDVTVTTPIGTGTRTGGFTVTGGLPPPPTVTGTSPGSAKVGDTLDVTITGTNLTGASAVSFGSEITVNSFTVDSATQITAELTIDTAAGTGTRDVSVTTPNGTGTDTGGFTVSGLQAPTITGVSPGSGEWGETLDVTITGTNFTDAGFVSFGPQIDVNFTVDSATQITAEITIDAELNTTGLRDVTVGNPDGPGTLAGGFMVTGTPVKIGVLYPLTGPIGPGGREAVNTIEMFLDETGWEIAGREIEIITEDTAADPVTGMEKARKLVEHDQVDLLFGLMHSGVALALRDYVHENEIPLIIATYAGAIPLSFELISDYILRPSFMNGIDAYALAYYVADEMNVETVALLAPAYAQGYEFANVFKGICKEKGIEIIYEVYTPYTEMDYAPYIANIPEEVDAVVTSYHVAQAIAFGKTYRGFGLTMPLLGQSGTANPHVIGPLGDDIIGIIASVQEAPFGYLPGLPEYQRVVEAYTADYDANIGGTGLNTWKSLQVLKAALETANGNIEDVLEFLEVMENTSVEGVTGYTVAIDPETNTGIFTMYIIEFVKRDGEIQFDLMKTYEDLTATDVRDYWLMGQE